MPRSKQVSDKKVLAVAREVFLAQGARASTATIARRVGLSQATLFQRFGDKATLLRAALGLESVDPERVLRYADDAERDDIELHLGRIATRLLKRMIPIVEVTEVLAGSREWKSAVAGEHAHGAIAETVEGLRGHLERIGVDAGLLQPLLYLVHGAAFMSVHAKPRERPPIRDGLVDAVTLLYRASAADPGQ